MIFACPQIQSTFLCGKPAGSRIVVPRSLGLKTSFKGKKSQPISIREGLQPLQSCHWKDDGHEAPLVVIEPLPIAFLYLFPVAGSALSWLQRCDGVVRLFRQHR